MTISTLVYFYENINSEEEAELLSLNDDVDLSEFYIAPPESLVQKTIQAVLSL